LIPEQQEMENMLAQAGFLEFEVKDQAYSYMAIARK
jgi:hypothetical protein